MENDLSSFAPFDSDTANLRRVAFDLDDPAPDAGRIVTLLYVNGALYRADAMLTGGALLDESDAMDASIGKAIRTAMRRAVLGVREGDER